MVPRRNCIHLGGGCQTKKETSAAIQKPQPSTVGRKRAADPERFKQYIIVCVDLPCGQTHIWFVFLAMVIDHSDAWPSCNESDHLWIGYPLWSSPPWHQLWPPERTGTPERWWWISQRRSVCDIHVCVFTCSILWLSFAIYSFSSVCFAILCKPSLLSSLAHWRGEGVYRENTHTRLQTHSRLGKVERMSSLSYLTRALTFHPGSARQAMSALSVTDPLDSCDKDEDDIWTPTKERGGRKMTSTRRAVKKPGRHRLAYILAFSFDNWLSCEWFVNQWQNDIFIAVLHFLFLAFFFFFVLT